MRWALELTVKNTTLYQIDIYIYLNQSNIEATQDIYLLQKEFVIAKYNISTCPPFR